MYLQTALWPRIDEPDDETLARVINALIYVTDDTRDYLIYSLNDTSPRDYMQGRPFGETTFLVEYRDSLQRRHFVNLDLTVEQTVQLFQSYRLQDGRWRETVDWKDITSRFPGLNSQVDADGEVWTNELVERGKQHRRYTPPANSRNRRVDDPPDDELLRDEEYDEEMD